MNQSKSLYEPRNEKPAFCNLENKDSDMLRGNLVSDQGV